MMKKKLNLRILASASLFVALDIVFTRFFSVTFLNVERVSLQFLPTSLCAALLGPIWGAAAAIAGDLLGMLINSAGAPYFPGFTLTAAIRGLAYGIGLHKKEVSYKRALATEAIVSFGINMLLNSLWLSMMYGKAFIGLVAMKFVVRIFFVPLAAYLTYISLKAIKNSNIVK